jgi:thioredoxin reductase (NADPH)
MFSRDDFRGIPIFSELADGELDYLAKTSADLRLLPGEYVIHEGETRRAFFVLVEGRVELTKFVDGAERVVGTERGPGEVFGEVPVILNTPSLVSFRTVEPSRVARIEAKDFHVVAASAPKLAAALRTAALDRLEGLQEIAAIPLLPPLAVIGPQGDNATQELREFLQRNSVEFDWVTPDEPSRQRYPMVRLRDGTLLNEPSPRDIAKAIGLSVVPGRVDYDVAIIGGGPAGLAAAVYGASEGLSTLLLEKEAPGGQAGTSSRIENYLGFPYGISGDELAHRALEQAKRLGAEIVVTRAVQRLDPASRTIFLDGNDVLRATTIVLATGVSWRYLEIASLDRLRGRGVYYGAAPGEARYVQAKDIFIVGGGNSAGQAAVNFANFANTVTLLVRGDALEKSMSHYLIEELKTKTNVRVETLSEVVDAHGDDNLEAITVINRANGTTMQRSASALFIMIGASADTAWLSAAIQRDAAGYIMTGVNVLQSGHWPLERDPYLLETSVPGIFAAGDVRSGSVKRVAAGVGEGSMVIALVHQYLANVSHAPPPQASRSEERPVTARHGA